MSRICAALDGSTSLSSRALSNLPILVANSKDAEISVLHMPAWKAKTLGKSTQEKVLLEP
jgi:hypothetical protein